MRKDLRAAIRRVLDKAKAADGGRCSECGTFTETHDHDCAYAKVERYINQGLAPGHEERGEICGAEHHRLPCKCTLPRGHHGVHINGSRHAKW